MKALNLQPVGTLLWVVLCLLIQTSLYAQSTARDYATAPDRQIAAPNTLSTAQADRMADKGLYSHTGNTYESRVRQELQAAIGNSPWWDELPREAQHRIRQKMQALPATPSHADIQEILSVSWEGQATRRNLESIRTKSTCPTGDVVLASQDDVDAFGDLGCTHVTGNLFINDSESAQKITDLTPLHQLQVVEGVFLITTSQLTSLKGLSNLSTVGYLRILSNEALTSLAGLSGITAFTGPLTDCGCSYLITNNFISFNPLIEDLSGLDNLTTVNSGFYISENHSLKNLNGLQNYSYSTAGLDIAHHPEMISLHGLSGLETVQGNLVIRNNARLKNLAGLTNLSTVGNAIIIDRNPNMKNLGGMPKLKVIGNDLLIVDNGSLLNIAGLNSVASVRNIIIINNSALERLVGFPNSMTSIEGDLVLYLNPSLKNVDELSKVTSVGGWLVIQDLPALEDIDGLANLTHAFDLTVAFCPLLDNLDGLSNFSYMDGTIGIAFLPELQNLDGLANLQYVGMDVFILENPSLSSCCGIYQLFCADPPDCFSDAIGGGVFMWNNGSGCTPDDIRAGGPCAAPAAKLPGGNSPSAHLSAYGAEFTLYPNPTQSEINLDLKSFGPGPVRVEISNSLGETLWQYWIDDVREENYLTVNLQSLTSLQAGVYFVSVTHGGQVYTKQMVLDR